MVSLRCKMMVRKELEKLGIIYKMIDLGMVETFENIDDEQWEKLKKNLLKSGLELLDNKKSILIEKKNNIKRYSKKSWQKAITAKLEKLQSSSTI